MTPIRSSLIVALLLAAGASTAQAISVTVATFQDPALLGLGGLVAARRRRS